MSRLNLSKIVLAAAGILLWFHGARADRTVLQWVGVALVFAAFLLRFAARHRGEDRDNRNGHG